MIESVVTDCRYGPRMTLAEEGVMAAVGEGRGAGEAISTVGEGEADGNGRGITPGVVVGTAWMGGRLQALITARLTTSPAHSRHKRGRIDLSLMGGTHYREWESEAQVASARPAFRDDLRLPGSEADSETQHARAL